MPTNRRVSEATTGSRLAILFRRLGVLDKPARLLLVALVPPLVILIFSRIQLMDDSYIYYRYAHNYVTGQGLVFNQGEKVEGFTSLLWQLMMIVPEALGLAPHIFAALLGVAFGVLALLCTWRICRQLDISLWGSFTAVIMLGLYPDFWRAMTNGLESGLFAFVLVLVIYLLLSGRLLISGIVGGLLFMTRPDSILVAPVCALYLLVVSANQSSSLRKRLAYPLLALLTPWLVLVIGITVWRLAYYGDWIPNSIRAKSMPLSVVNFAMVRSNILDGLHYWLGFLVSAAPLVLGALLALIMETRRPAVWLCLGIIAAQVPIVLGNGGDWMPNYRLLIVYAPLLAVLLGITADRIAAIQASSRINFLQLQPIILFSVVLLLLAGGAVLLRSAKWDATPDYVAWQDNQWDATPDIVVEKAGPCWRTLAITVRPALLPTDRLSPEGLGIFSYMLPNTYMHDIFGLVDRHVARHGTEYLPKWGKAAPGYTYYTIQPNLILVHSGLLHLSRMASASNGTYNENYQTYSFMKPPPGCEGTGEGTEGVMISIRRDSTERILPAFAELGPRPVTVPNEANDLVVARSGLHTYTLAELPPPEPLSADAGLQNVEVQGSENMYAHPPSGATFTIKNERHPVSVAFTPSFVSDVPVEKTDGVTFEVWSGKERVYQRFVHPDDSVSQVALNLPQARTEDELKLSFVTRVGPAGDRNYDWALWRDVRIIVGQREGEE